MDCERGTTLQHFTTLAQRQGVGPIYHGVAVEEATEENAIRSAEALDSLTEAFELGFDGYDTALEDSELQVLGPELDALVTRFRPAPFQLPSMPTMPGAGATPSAPSMPSMPKMPDGMPKLPDGLPKLPDGLPSLPKIPELPETINTTTTTTITITIITIITITNTTITTTITR